MVSSNWGPAAVQFAKAITEAAPRRRGVVLCKKCSRRHPRREPCKVTVVRRPAATGKRYEKREPDV